MARAIEMLILALLPAAMAAEGPLPAAASLPLVGLWLLEQLLLWRQVPKWYNYERVNGEENGFRSFLEPLVESSAA